MNFILHNQSMNPLMKLCLDKRIQTQFPNFSRILENFRVIRRYIIVFLGDTLQTKKRNAAERVTLDIV